VSFRGWISPDGRRFTTNPNDDHNDSAARLLKRYFRQWEWENAPEAEYQGAIFASLALQSRGWIRVVGENSFSTGKVTAQNAPVLRGLILRVHPSDRLYIDLGDDSLVLNRDMAIGRLNALGVTL
jgi:hypothetical protein